MAQEEKEEVSYIKPTSQLDLEARLENDNAQPGPIETVNPGAPKESKDAYLGTDPIYQNHANDTERPISGDDDSAERKADELFLKAYEKPEVNVKRREALEKGEEQEVLPVDTLPEVTERRTTIHAADPGTGEVAKPDEDKTSEGKSEEQSKATRQEGASTEGEKSSPREGAGEEKSSSPRSKK